MAARSKLLDGRLAGIRVIADAKLTHYLPDVSHPVGGAKARYFVAHGFSATDPNAFAAALLDHASRHPIHAERQTDRGVSREVRCQIATPDGRNPCIRVIWYQEEGETTHRLVTAYPA